MKRLRIVIKTVLTALFLVVATAQAATPTPAKSIILCIGDGMGPSHVLLSRLYSQQVLGKDLAMVRVMNSGFTAYMTTQPAGAPVTDSAAAATAMATGFKTTNGLIGMDPDRRPLPSILEKAAALGKATGLVTSTRITHATPAAFAAHVDHRGKEDDIARQLIAGGVDVLLGGGRRHFLSQTAGGGRTDGRDLLAEAGQLGYTLVEDAATLAALKPTAAKKLLGLFRDSHLAFAIDRDKTKEPELAELAAKAIELLDNNDKGFFLLIEGGRIDHAAHAHDAAGVVQDTLAFDRAVAVAMTYQAAHPDTLLIVTGDHETGGLMLTGEGSAAAGADGDKVLPSLRALSNFSASFADVIGPALAKAGDNDAVTAIIGKYTGQVIGPETAQLLRAGAGAKRQLDPALHAVTGVAWAGGGHSAAPLMLFARGPLAERFSGLLDNTDLARIMEKAFGLAAR